MFTPTYFVSVATVCLGASTQFYSFGIINPEQELLTQWINMTYIRRNGGGPGLNLTEMNLYWSFVVSSIAIGAIVGALLVRKLSEWQGRRNALIINGCVNVFAALLEYLSKSMASPEFLIFGRLILGANMGLSTGLVPMYLMEITPTKYRGAAGTFHMVAVAFSDWFSLLLGLPEVLGSADNWPLAFAFPGFPAFLLCLVLPFCPESPKYTLFARGDHAKAMEDLKKLVDEDEAEFMYESLQSEAALMQDGSCCTFRQIFFEREFRLPLLITIVVMVTQQFTGCSAVFAYSTDMFIDAGLDPRTARFSTLAVGVAYFLFACSAPILIEQVGRRILLIGQLAMCSVSLLFLSIFVALQHAVWQNFASYATIAALIVYMCAYGVGCAIPWLISSEIFPTKFRAAAVTVAVTVAWSLSFVVSTCYLPFQQIVGTSFSFVPFILVSAGGAVFVYCLLPETRGKQATDIVREIRQRVKSISHGQSPFAEGSAEAATTTAQPNGQISELTALLRLQRQKALQKQQQKNSWHDGYMSMDNNA
ncbi:hypothetical protein niasHS_007658 [Heterodera schachtii]|uniref:Major facilitator superfamily (MFS) profile domain-containing protein n=1 Tax=Heterodera schachtii TaxID=97005 RepID=A0ABD2JPD3_HETSC